MIKNKIIKLLRNIFYKLFCILDEYCEDKIDSFIEGFDNGYFYGVDVGREEERKRIIEWLDFEFEPASQKTTADDLCVEIINHLEKINKDKKTIEA